ncbi:helix-turn-helix transcriptional regulator [Clostridium hydrogeniformans]|uniref:helix-turn-helix transcriptional regulator n=1 Tax=Clostridium hydrogeniformans TaxID=349933 RepID=UPI000485A84A|nr:helix-turn-helix domain-containing protein [Clostridium hydrogeniformans]
MGVTNRLKEIRMKEYMMDQNEFAKFIGVTNKVYWSWENDKSRPTLEKALEISKKLNINVNEIWHLE